MPIFKVAHIHEQGQDMIIFPLTSAFGDYSVADQTADLSELERKAHAGGLAGLAAAVWDGGSGRIGYMGPQHWHGFLRGLTFNAVVARVNKSISW